MFWDIDVMSWNKHFHTANSVEQNRVSSFSFGSHLYFSNTTIKDTLLSD